MVRKWGLSPFSLLSGGLLFCIALWAQAGNQAQSQSTLIGLPGAILNSQINSQQKMWRKTNVSPCGNLHRGLEPRQDAVIFTDRLRRPISREEFMRQLQIHHAEIYNNSRPQTSGEPDIEPLPPEDASFQ